MYAATRALEVTSDVKKMLEAAPREAESTNFWALYWDVTHVGGMKGKKPPLDLGAWSFMEAINGLSEAFSM